MSYVMQDFGSFYDTRMFFYSLQILLCRVNTLTTYTAAIQNTVN